MKALDLKSDTSIKDIFYLDKVYNFSSNVIDSSVKSDERSLSTIDKGGCRICCDQASDGQKALDMIKLIANDFESNATTATCSSRRTSTSNKKVPDIVIISDTYDLILMDYQMPNCHPTYQSIRMSWSNVFGSEVEFMRQSGADKVLSKPVQLRDLENLVLEL